MKKLFLLYVLAFLPLFAMAEIVPTKFLGIPIDGTKQEMILKLEEKGFIYNGEQDWLTGEFNGKDVIIKIVTHNRKVYRISVIYRYFYTGEEVKEAYNNLFQQLRKNSHYIPVDIQQKPIPDDENIVYEMKVHQKEYYAGFLQVTNKSDSTLFFTQSFKDCTKKNLELLPNENNNDSIYRDSLIKIISYICWHEELKTLYISNIVGICIDEAFEEKYNLIIWYENGYNKAHGEDL